MELDPPGPPLRLAADGRKRLPEPLGVNLLAVADVRLPALKEHEADLCLLYEKILGLERVRGPLAFRADNFVLYFDVVEKLPQNREYRYTGIEVMDLALVAKKCPAAKLEFTLQRGLTPGSEMLELLDAAGNWLRISEFRRIG